MLLSQSRAGAKLGHEHLGKANKPKSQVKGAGLSPGREAGSLLQGLGGLAEAEPGAEGAKCSPLFVSLPLGHSPGRKKDKEGAGLCPHP